MPITRREVSFWCLLGAVIICLSILSSGGPWVGDDGSQYLSIADNIARGNGIRTSIVHWDEERSHGEIPAPAIHMPPGYPAVIALLSLTGMGLDWSGLVCSAAFSLALVPLLASLAGQFALSPLTTRILLFLFLTNSNPIRFGSAVLTEALFTALTTGALLVLITCLQREWLSDHGTSPSGSSPIDTDETLATYIFPVWTGTDRNGVAIGPNCLDWEIAISSNRGRNGFAGARIDQGRTTVNVNGFCGGSRRFYCIQD